MDLLNRIVGRPGSASRVSPLAAAAAAAAAAAGTAPAGAVTLDSAAVQALTMDAAGEYADQHITMMAMAVVNQWVTTEDLDDGESIADRLLNLLVGIADADQDGELDDDEQDVVGIALNATFDYLVGLGVSEADADALLTEWDSTVAERVREVVASNLPEGDEAEDELIDSVVFSPADQEPVMDAAYRRTMAIRQGRKVRINKRISGTIVLSGRQKVALRKARIKATSAKAMMRRARSMRIRASMNM